MENLWLVDGSLLEEESPSSQERLLENTLNLSRMDYYIELNTNQNMDWYSAKSCGL